jgi:hypothetical protein
MAQFNTNLLPLAMLYWHFCVNVLAIFNYSFWVRFEKDRLSDDLRNTYLAFCIIGMVAYAVVGGPGFFTAYKYSRDKKSRGRKIRIGVIGMYFLSTWVLFILDLYIIWQYGVLNVLQGICFFLQWFTWTMESFATWFFYMWQVARFLHGKTGTDRLVMFSEQGMQLRVPPPLTWSKPLPGQPDVV